MIKGLYFKLNMDNPNDEEIYNFFKRYSNKGMTKIELLFMLMKNFKHLVEDKIEND